MARPNYWIGIGFAVAGGFTFLGTGISVALAIAGAFGNKPSTWERPDPLAASLIAIIALGVTYFFYRCARHFLGKWISEIPPS